jgi:ubiquinone/menaquinone biosynthesis C-methylase UbiE
VITVETARELFPEIDPSHLVRPERIIDLDRDGLTYCGDGQMDFVIMSHVLEHLSNPVKAIREAFRVLPIGGRLMVVVPDRDFTFDRRRALTPFEHLWSDFENHVTENADDHYIDFLSSAAPHVFADSAEKFAGHIRYSRLRKEHAHVWTSGSFREFLLKCIERLGYQAEPLYESLSDENGCEYCGVWERRG